MHWWGPPRRRCSYLLPHIYIWYRWPPRHADPCIVRNQSQSLKCPNGFVMSWITDLSLKGPTMLVIMPKIKILLHHTCVAHWNKLYKWLMSTSAHADARPIESDYSNQAQVTRGVHLTATSGEEIFQLPVTPLSDVQSLIFSQHPFLSPTFMFEDCHIPITHLKSEQQKSIHQ